MFWIFVALIIIGLLAMLAPGINAINDAANASQ